jgi:hypothetical protein
MMAQQKATVGLAPAGRPNRLHIDAKKLTYTAGKCDKSLGDVHRHRLSVLVTQSREQPVEDILREPVELIDAHLDAIAGGFFNGSFNAFSFNGNGSHDGNGNGNFSGNVAFASANGNDNGNGNGNITMKDNIDV